MIGGWRKVWGAWASALVAGKGCGLVLWLTAGTVADGEGKDEQEKSDGRAGNGGYSVIFL